MSERTRAIIWGASGHATVVADAARRGPDFEIAGFIDELAPSRRGEAFADASVLGGLDALDELLAAGVRHVLLGVGHNQSRLRIADEAARRGFLLGTVVHPSAIVASSAEVGSGVFIGAGAVVNPYARVGRAAIINTKAVVEHHCEVREGAHVAPGAVLAGNVCVGRLSWVGLGAAVIERRRIGDESLIGAGAVVVQDIGSGLVAFGNPARPRRPTDVR